MDPFQDPIISTLEVWIFWGLAFLQLPIETMLISTKAARQTMHDGFVAVVVSSLDLKGVCPFSWEHWVGYIFVVVFALGQCSFCNSGPEVT